MQNITRLFDHRFDPVKALLIYRHEGQLDETGFFPKKDDDEIYVESYDIGKNGKPINAHPLSVKEMQELSLLFAAADEQQGNCFKSKGILPENVLQVQQSGQGFAMWYTPPMETQLFFVPELKIPSGTAPVPAMLWRATASQLQVFALKGKTKPRLKTPLFQAPFLNVYANGAVCMGTVDVQRAKPACLEEFISGWQQFFFQSYFSHTIGRDNTSTPTVALWRSLMNSGQPFPTDELQPAGHTLKTLLS